MLRATARDGEMFPVLYRGAWYDYQRRRWVCYPVGIHWIAWAVRWLWMWTYRQTRPDAWELACAEIRREVQSEYFGKIEALRDQNDELQKENHRLTCTIFDLRRELDKAKGASDG